MKVLVLGAGKMTEAILLGLKKTEDLSQWEIFSPSGISAQKLAVKIGARAVSDLKEVKNPDWILVGCKPQQLKDLKAIIQDKFNGSLFVSILAALSEDDQRGILGAKELIRVMPNLPVEFNDGVILLSSESAKTRLKSFETLFSKIGYSKIVSEDELEELTLLTGSAPAFFYEFSQILAQGFTSLDPEGREKLIKAVLKGAGVAAKNSSSSLGEMTSAVTSKGGVTIATLEEWRSKGFKELIQKGIEAGKNRAKEIKSLLQK